MGWFGRKKDEDEGHHEWMRTGRPLSIWAAINLAYATEERLDLIADQLKILNQTNLAILTELKRQNQLRPVA
jgi:hypothetical protein